MMLCKTLYTIQEPVTSVSDWIRATLWARTDSCPGHQPIRSAMSPLE